LEAGEPIGAGGRIDRRLGESDMGKTGPVLIALLALVALATPAWANSCALQGSFVASAALNAPGLTQALVRFEFVPPVRCEDGVPGTVHMAAKMIGRGGGAETGRVVPTLLLETAGSYLVNADGHLEIQAGSLVIEGLVAFVEPEATVAVALDRPSSANLNLSKSNINIFVFTASDTGNPNVGFSGMAATTVKSSKSNSSE
jgi:hypothetical protein